MFAARGFFGAGGANVNPAFSASVVNTLGTPGVRSASVTLNSDGTASSSGGALPNWALPAFAGVGSPLWVRLTASGAANTVYSGMTPGTWYGLATSRTVTVQNSNASVEGVGSFSLDLAADAGGSAIVASLVGAVTWDVGYLP